ncbi:MAG: diacylglycerol kinase family protein [Acidimicrobiia bacterium]|nr:diacylglycerol kinase family protein [Acidimicrobiia bacterium]
MWWVVVNPAAGNARELVERTHRALEELEIDYEIRQSESPGHVCEIVREGNASGVRRFAGVGGDGTAHLILNGIMQQDWAKTPGLALLPAGSGSDFIRTFALPRTLETAAPHLATSDWYPCDVLSIDGAFGRRYALNVVEAGVGAAAVSTAARMPRWFGGKRYSIAFWLTLPRFAPATVRTVVDGRKDLAGSAIAIIVANGQFFGGGMNIAPRASVADGQLDLQVFAGPRRKALTVMPRVIRGMHLGHKNVRRMVGGSVEIDVPGTWPIEADGEALGKGPISVTVLPAAIEFKI